MQPYESHVPWPQQPQQPPPAWTGQPQRRAAGGGTTALVVLGLVLTSINLLLTLYVFLVVRQVVGFGRVGHVTHVGPPAERGQRDPQVVQGRAAADDQVAAVRIGGRQVSGAVGVEVQRVGADHPAPRLGVVAGRSVASGLGRYAAGYGLFGYGLQQPIAAQAAAERAYLPKEVKAAHYFGRLGLGIGGADKVAVGYEAALEQPYVAGE